MHSNISDEQQKKDSAIIIGDLVFQLLANCQRKEEILAEQFHISVPEFRCLRTFRDREDLTIKALTEIMVLSGSRLTRIIDGLEEKGFVTRSFHDVDRRSINVRLTKKGLVTTRQLEDRYIQIHQEILDEFPLDQQNLLSNGLQQLLSSLERWLRNT